MFVDADQDTVGLDIFLLPFNGTGDVFFCCGIVEADAGEVLGKRRMIVACKDFGAFFDAAAGENFSRMASSLPSPGSGSQNSLRV